jgi:cell division protein ZapA (FtsZ GTPase activity inhibitor)
VDVDTGVIVATSRAFAASVHHGCTTAIVGMVLAGFPMGKIDHPLLRWIIGLAIAISIHVGFNTTALHQFAYGQEGLLALVGISFSALLFVAGAVTWGLLRERRHLRKSLGKTTAGGAEARLVRHADELDDLLAPVEQRFGALKREQVSNALLLAAQLAMKQEQIKKTRDPELRSELAPQITELKVELKQARRAVGIYIMSYVRSIMPKATWSLWVRLDQTLARRQPTSGNLWQVLGTRLVGHNSAAGGMYARVSAELETRAAALAAEGED